MNKFHLRYLVGSHIKGNNLVTFFFYMSTECTCNKYIFFWLIYDDYYKIEANLCQIFMTNCITSGIKNNAYFLVLSKMPVFIDFQKPTTVVTTTKL